MSTAVMAHPDRAEMAQTLARDHDAWITWDTKGSRWDTGRRAWLSIANSPDPWGLVLQDDARPARHLLEVIPKMLTHVPEGSPVVLYAGATRHWNTIWRTVSRGTSWVVMDSIWWGPAIIMPTNLIETVIAHGDAEVEKWGSDQYDHLLGSWFTRGAVPVYYTWPPLVDHDPGPSLVAGRRGGRRAFRPAVDARRVSFGGETLKIDRPI